MIRSPGGRGGVVGIGAQVVLWAGLVFGLVQSGAIRVREAGPSSDVSGTLGRSHMPAPGPAPGWELYGVPLHHFAPLGWMILIAVVASYTAMVGGCLWKKRSLAAGWWLLPITLATVGFFLLAYLGRPTILH